MPAKGRKRLTEDDLQARTATYCKRYGGKPGPKGLPPFPSGQRETPQHREWLGLYKLWNRLGRRLRGQCERCSSPASENSIFCERHRHGELPPVARNGCPICGKPNGEPRGRQHTSCAQLVSLAESLGPEAFERAREHLWPSKRMRRGR